MLIRGLLNLKKYIVNHSKIYIAYVGSKLTNKYKKYWLIGERGFDARDNGYHFYKYMVENHPEQPVVYVISDKQVDFERIKELKGEYVIQNSLKHGIIYFACSKIISTHSHWIFPQWTLLAKMQHRFKIFIPKAKKVFLQHGITKDYINWLTKAESGTDLFICGAKPEYEFIKDNFGYLPNEVKYTGFARYDKLYNCMDVKSKMILLMPTWRQVMWSYKSDEDFLNSTYFKTYNSLINNPELIAYLENTNTEFIFYPHIEVQKRMQYFSTTSSNIKICGMNDADVQDLLLRCDMLITDYSSVFFDVAYMQKNILFYQFDYEEYRAGHYQEGYFDYKNGLGDVCLNEIELVNEIITTHAQPLKPRYKEKIANFFVYRDNHNCERIYNEIMKM